MGQRESKTEVLAQESEGSGTTSGSPEEDQKDHGMNTNTQPERMIPPKAIKFHSVTGVQIELLENGLYAKRKGPDFAHDNGVVYGSQPIPYRGRCTFEVAITEHGDHGGGSILIGVMKRPSGSPLKESDVPRVSEEGYKYCMWRVANNVLWNGLSSYYVHSIYGSLTDNVGCIGKGDKVGLRLSSDGTLSFFFNGRSQGVAATDVHEEGQDIYPVIDVRNRCYAVRITRAEIQEVQDLQELCAKEICSCLDWSPKDVNLLPLPPRLKKLVEHYMDYL